MCMLCTIRFLNDMKTTVNTIFSLLSTDYLYCLYTVFIILFCIGYFVLMELRLHYYLCNF